MTIITIPRDEIQTYLDNNPNVVYSFSWSNQHQAPDIEFDVRDDFEYETNDFIEQADFDALEKDLELLEEKYDTLKTEMATMEEVKDAEIELLKKKVAELEKAASKPFWKF